MAVRGRLRGLALLAMAAVQAHAQQLPPVAFCFNGGEPQRRVQVWMFEGYTDWKYAYQDWKAARTGTPQVLVFSFPPGDYSYDLGSLGGCFYMPAAIQEKVYRCDSGSLRITQMKLPELVAGEFRVSIVNNGSKGMAFKAGYCPPFRR